jgi:hypothetical protein
MFQIVGWGATISHSIRRHKMLAILFAAIWFGYRGHRANRSSVGWGLVGVLVFVLLKVLVTIMAVNANVRSQEEATDLIVVLNTTLFGGIFLLGFLIQPKQGSSVSVSTSDRPKEPENG